jgi:spore cortex formation protein SpoVR/YcgB (stage V sporulation)
MAMIPATRREGHLSQSIPIRLGGLAADLARIASFTEIHGDAAVERLLDESRAFIEWVAPDIPIDDAARLVEIQRALTRWRHIWAHAQGDPDARERLAKQARAWSDEVLAMSGLLD